MRAHELECIHGIGHSGGVHGCDGCCSIIAKAVEERIIKQLVDLNVMRVDALGDIVFVNCNTLEVQYLGDALIKGQNNGTK